MKKSLFALLFAVTGFISAFAEGDDWFANKFPEKLINAKGKGINPATALKGKTVAIYFSASWCGPCRGFTPKLVEFYKYVAKRDNIEVVLVSSDKNERAMMNYMKADKMPWLAVPFNAKEMMELKKQFSTGGIPQLVILDSEGKLISKNARWDVVLLGFKAPEAWKEPNYVPKTYQDYQNSSSASKSRSNYKKRRKRR